MLIPIAVAVSSGSVIPVAKVCRTGIENIKRTRKSTSRKTARGYQSTRAKATVTIADNIRDHTNVPTSPSLDVMKGMKMAGRFGADKRTVKGLEILDIDEDKDLLVISGSVAGPNGGSVSVCAEGDMTLEEVEKKIEDKKDSEQEKQGGNFSVTMFRRPSCLSE